MDEADIRFELRRLAARLNRIEQHLGLTPDKPPPVLPDESLFPVVQLGATPPEPKPSPAPPTRASARPAAAITPPPHAALWPTPTAAPQASAPPAPPRPTEPLSRAPVPPARTTAPLPAPDAKPRTSLEVMIGERWMAWVGAIVVVVAVGFFVKLAYDLGWWGRLSPLAKTLAAAGFGAVLVACGEVALRRIGRVAAVSLFGAGVGTLYLTAFATFRYFNLLPRAGAFWLMLLVAALGFALTLRGRMLAMGVLSLLGGYLTPVLLAGAPTFPAALPLYVTALLAVGLSLSALLPADFRVLRYVAVAMHVVVASLWAQREGADHWLIALSFMTVWWAMVTAEALWAAFRGRSASGNPVVSLLFTFWYVSVGCGVLAAANPGQHNWLGLFSLSVAAVCTWIALPFGPGLAALKAVPRSAVQRMVAALWAQVGILCAAAIAVQFREQSNSYGQSIGWLVMAAACIELGRRLPSRPVVIFGLVVGVLGLARVWAIDHGLTVLRTVAWSYGDVILTYWGMLALAAVAVTHFAALRLRTAGSNWGGILAVCLNGLSGLQWLALCVMQCRALALTGGWYIGAALLLAAAPLLRRRDHVVMATAILLATAVKWLLVDALRARLSSGWVSPAVTPVWNWSLAVALVVAVSGYWVYRLGSLKPASGVEQQPRTEPAAWRQNALLCGILLLLAALSLEIDRGLSQARAAGTLSRLWPASQETALWWTLLWTAGGVATLVAGRAARLRVLLMSGGGLVTVGAAVWLGYDTLYWRLQHAVVLSPVVLNLQFLVGLLVAGMVVATARLGRKVHLQWLGEKSADFDLTATTFGAAVALGLWLGSFELDRFFAPEALRVSNAAMARQTALSVYWGVYAIALVALGFWKRSPALRYTGLALLGLTLAKVMIFDLAHVRYVYRVLSLLAVGLLFIATSIAYARLASHLRARGQL